MPRRRKRKDQIDKTRHGAQALEDITWAALELVRVIIPVQVNLSLAYDETLEAWSRALELHEGKSAGHGARVAELALRLGRGMGVSEDELINVRRGSLLHDLGKIGIPQSILHKPGPLDDQEWEIIRRHPLTAHELLSPIGFLHRTLEVPYCHYEYWDGTGYPRGIQGKQIPLAARITAVAHVWDILRLERPYRPAWPADWARRHIRDQAGKQFDPKVVDVFLEIVNGGAPESGSG
jgi:HD-GYP domain-containing protein (c-di-GMP phosphodiesterase class II)